MAQIIQEPSAVQQPMNIFNTMINFFRSSWKWLLAGVVIFALGMIVYYLVKKMDDERKERDEPGYQLYKSTKRACELQANKRLIRKYWSWINLLFFGLPLIKKEHSAKIVDRNDNLIGWYRGDYMSMDNSWNLLIYKVKSFIFFEDTFVLKIPLMLKFKVPTTKKGKVSKVVDNGVKEKKGVGNEQYKVISLKKMVTKLPNGDIKVYCSSIERIGLYYYCPIYPIDEDKGFLDFRKVMEGAIIDNTYQILLQRLLNTGAKQMEKGMMFNPFLQYSQKAPEKTREESKLDDGIGG